VRLLLLTPCFKQRAPRAPCELCSKNNASSLIAFAVWEAAVRTVPGPRPFEDEARQHCQQNPAVMTGTQITGKVGTLPVSLAHSGDAHACIKTKSSRLRPVGHVLCWNWWMRHGPGTSCLCDHVCCCCVFSADNTINSSAHRAHTGVRDVQYVHLQAPCHPQVRRWSNVAH
jgi:hypothetical protein